jgi:hypothetical protein
LAVLIIVWLACSPTVAAAPPVTAAGDRDMIFGIAGHAWWLDQHLETFVGAYRDLGVTTVRLSVDWKYIEPTPGVYRWDRYDRVLDRLVDEHLTIVAVFVTVPPWAASDPTACAVEEREPRDCDLRGDQIEAFERVVRATVTRYPFIRAWEFWNEPELWRHLGEDVGDYLPLLSRFYRIVKEIDPSVQVAASSLAGWEYVGWLYDVSEAMLGPGVRPWDAIAFHPYNTHRERDARGAVASLRTAEIERLRAEMVARGDGTKPLWLTEYGWDEGPKVQAAQLRRALTWIVNQDYIAMAHLHMLHDWERERFGLLRTEPDVFGQRPIDATTRFVPKEPYYSAFRAFPRPGPPPALPGAAAASTGLAVAPVYLDTWRERARDIYGAPLTRAFWARRAAGDYALVQYFEGGRLEWTHGLGVQAGLVGDEALQRRGWLDVWGRPLVAQTEPQPPSDDGSALYFPETGHALLGEFRAAWEAAGGLPALGYPRTPVLNEPHSDGVWRRVQYTQRGRLEQIAGAAPSPVRLAPLGRETLHARGWLGGDN